MDTHDGHILAEDVIAALMAAISERLKPTKHSTIMIKIVKGVVVQVELRDTYSNTKQLES